MARREQQISHRLKPVRDDKSSGVVTAQLKLRRFKAGKDNGGCPF
jgi:hypothetical protein